MRGARPRLVVIDGNKTTFPPAPEWLSKIAKQEWTRVQPLLEAKHYLTDLDLAGLENYCVAQGRVRECEADIVGCNNLDTKAKLWRMQKQAMDAARQLASELGLTPVSRSRAPMRDDDLFGDGENDPLNMA